MAFLVKFNSAGIRQWGTYYGGSGDDRGFSCKADNSGNIYMAGRTVSSGISIATLGSHQPNYGGGNDAFLVKFNSAGIRQWGTYYGGSLIEEGNSCATDAAGNVYMTGITETPSSASIATFGSHQPTFGGGFCDAFLVKFNSSGIRQWGTYYGGIGEDRGLSFATDVYGNVFMAGYTNSPSGFTSIATLGSHQSTFGGGYYDAFLVKFTDLGIRQWGTYYGGNNAISGGDDRGFSCLADASGNVYMVGATASPTGTIIASSGSHQSAFGGGNNDAFLVKLSDCVYPSITVNSGAICAGQSFTINPTGANTYTIQGGNVVVSPSINTTYTVIGTSTAGCASQAFATSNLTVNPNPIITVNNGVICAGQNFTINPNGANNYTIQGGSAVVSPTSNASFTVAGTSTAGCVSQAVATSSLFVNQNPTITVNNGAICAGQNFTINPNGANTYTIQGGNAVVSPTSNASFTLSGTSTAGCVSQAFATSNLTVNPNPTITVNNGTICVGQNFTINPNGANTYTIQGGNAVVSPSINTTYTVIGTSTAGCISQAFVTSSMLVNPNPIITVNNGTICVGQTFTINPTGANTYTIQGGNALVSPSINTTYTVIGTSTAGCISQAFVTSSMLVNPNPIITVNNGTICAGQNFTINPNGANTYTIQGGNAVVSPTSNSNYTVVGTSTAGCLSQAVATSSLIVNASPTVTVNSGAICIGESFTISPNGANTYTIQGASAVVSPSISTTYTVAGTSTVGCVSQGFATSSLTVNQCVGISNQNMGIGSVSIYPNPTNGEFTIELVSLNNTYITITNVLGQIIKTQKAELMNQINLNLFEQGVYFINVMENNQSVYRGSIIKE
jgi:propanediol utilization protein